jgi:serine-type D-Ala-D-Ala carboxypeptidase
MAVSHWRFLLLSLCITSWLAAGCSRDGADATDDILVAESPRDDAVLAVDPWQPADTPLEPQPFLQAFDPHSAESIVAAGIGVAYPGAALALGRGAETTHLAALGRIGWRDASPPVVIDTTLYDLASLTKAVATTTAVLLLVQDGKIRLDDPVRRHLPEFEGRWKDDVTWRHLLTHTSGLPPAAAVRGATPDERRRRMLRTLLYTRPGERVDYSDLGFVVLWAAAGRAAGEPLPAMLRRRVWQPLGMSSTRFIPGRGCETCAPTLRLQTGEPFRGLPADMLARQLGSIEGHAGLFSTAPDLARFMAMVASGGELDGVRIFTPGHVAELVRQQPGAGRRTLGWTAFCPDEPPEIGTPCARPVVFGHTGWTGTTLWLSPGNAAWGVLLTNRSYERPNRPYPLEQLRRELFLVTLGAGNGRPADAWLRQATGP